MNFYIEKAINMWDYLLDYQFRQNTWYLWDTGGDY